MAEPQDYGEPWRLLEVPGLRTMKTNDGFSVEGQHILSKRAIACVNACKGIPTEALEQGVIPELLDVCDKTKALIVLDYGGRIDDWIVWENEEKIFPLKLLNTVLAKLKGETAADG